MKDANSFNLLRVLSYAISTRAKPAVLREGNRKSPGTAAHICKSISEIPGISEMFWYETLQNFQMDAKTQRSNIKI